MSFFQAVRLNYRAWHIWWNVCPRWFEAVILSSVVSAVSPYISLWMTARIIEELAGGRNPEIVWKLVTLTIGVTGILSFLDSVLKRLKRYETDSASCLYNRIFMDKMLSLDYEHMDSQAAYDLYAQATQNDKWSGLGLREALVLFERLVGSVARILGGVFLTVPMFLAEIPNSSGRLAWLNHPLSVVLLMGFMLIVSTVSSVCTDKGQGYWTRYADETRFGNRLADFYVFLNKDKRRAMDLRMYNQQEKVCNVLLDRENPFKLSSKIVQYARGAMGMWMAGSKSVSALLTAVIYFFVCFKAWAGAYGLGSVTQFIGALFHLFSGISKLMNALAKMVSNGSFLETAFEFLDISNEMYQGSLTTEKRADRQYEIEFRNVSFRYPGTKTDVLRHVNIKFPIGSRLAIVGMNGSGKTTFIKLLCRLYDPVEGQILLNGIDICKYRYEDYRSLFSVVFQDFQLFSLPLGENVAGCVSYSSEQAEESLKKAGFTNWKQVMPSGLNTPLYKDLCGQGVSVSGGEAQKIAIARALYKDAPFMILDEPTAALDPVAEAEIYEQFWEIVGDRTAVFISHRLSSCKLCDTILVFHEGEIVQQGTHEELVKDRNGVYKKLWEAQAQYYAKRL